MTFRALTLAGLLLVAAASAGRAASAEDERLAASVAAFVDELAGRDAFSGVVLFASGTEVLVHQAHGSASIEHAVPNRLDTRFDLGSMNKMFTAVAVAQLAAQGRLSFDDEVGEHLPDYPNGSVTGSVTIHHLLTHTSGMGNYRARGSEFHQGDRTRWRNVVDYLSLLGAEPLAFEPGSDWSYSNSAFVLLGRLVEVVSGQDYFDYVREHVYAPSGMTRSGSLPLDQIVEGVATGYTRRSAHGAGLGPLRNTLFQRAYRGGPAGGGYATAVDLYRFARALRSHELLDPGTTETVLTGKISLPAMDGATANRYAYGFWDNEVGGLRVVGHGGGTNGVSCQLDVYMDRPYILVVLSNYDPPVAQQVAHRVREMVVEASR